MKKVADATTWVQTKRTLSEKTVPKFLVNAQYSSAALRGLIEDPVDCQKITEKLLAGAGVTLHEWFFVPDTGESVVIVEGSHDQVRLARMVAMATGAFANSHAVEIISSRELTTLAQNAADIGRDYVAPNMDQIDRMLLDE